MLHVINGGDKPTQKFHDFVDLCCKGFNLVRKNGNLLLNLFALMASSGIPGIAECVCMCVCVYVCVCERERECVCV
jgi:hypothetical protein